MFSTFFIENPSLVRVLFGVAVVAGALIGWLMYRSGRRRALLALAALSLVAALALAFSPSGNRAIAFCTVQFSVPFQGVETLANIALLLPATLFAALAVRRPVAVAAAASGFSALIELVQAVFPALSRACDTNDWFMNTIGVIIGAVVAAGIIRFTRRRGVIPREHDPSGRATTR